MAERRHAGFSLIEIIVALAVMSLMLGAMAPLALRQLDSARREATRREMQSLAQALIGDPTRDEYGYLGDMGQLPPALIDLNDPTGKPAWTVSTADGIGYGFAGPYAPGEATAATGFVDGWGQAYQYSNLAAQVTSAGPDRTFGTADDLLVPNSPPTTTGSLVITVLGIPNSGPPVVLPSSGFRVWVASASAGTRSEPERFPSSNPFAVSALHIGLHGLRVRGQGGSYDGVEARRAVTVRRGQLAVELALEEP